MISFQLCSGARSPTWSRFLAVIVMSLFLTLSTTVCAYAEEGFLGGLQTLVDPDSEREVENDPVRDYEYEPTEIVLSAPAQREYDEDATTVDYINGTLDSFNRVKWSGSGLPESGLSLLDSIKRMYELSNLAGPGIKLLTVAVGLVFMWWGVRKVIHILFAAFRSGRMTVGGYDLNPNSYYFGTRAKDWR